jgi:hypothetical protein
MGHGVGAVFWAQHGVGADMRSVRRLAANGTQQAVAQRAFCARDLRPRGWANRAGWVECWCWAVVGKKRNEWAAGLHRGKEKVGGGLGRLGNMAQ